ncbi:MAG TPA: DUF924 family protein [Oligoflexus sp.]|uniref:DUF924 family protein n=1 Tax=Oligoflexus sp. TaxID=1971216 RepID=UPI002D3ABB91|nr:DUF924 family protein [Oligoflexus sp.]HYX33077.1 DUF924 family protein [Oligoflexus sp.]
MTHFTEPLIKTIHELWFGELDAEGRALPEKSRRWFAKDPEFDKLIRKHYLEYIDPAFMGAFDRWMQTDEGLVALAIILDQFPRNMFRNSPRSFAYEKKALTFAGKALQDDRFLKMPAVYAYFCLMPTMHCEDLKIQDTGLDAFTRLLTSVSPAHKEMIGGAQRYAKAHRDIIERFGRFPHRNEILGRPSTPEELAFLKEPGSSF